MILSLIIASLVLTAPSFFLVLLIVFTFISCISGRVAGFHWFDCTKGRRGFLVSLVLDVDIDMRLSFLLCGAGGIISNQLVKENHIFCRAHEDAV